MLTGELEQFSSLLFDGQNSATMAYLSTGMSLLFPAQ